MPMSQTRAGQAKLRFRVGLGLAVVALLLAVKTGSGGSEGNRLHDERAETWPVGAIVAVEVEGGKATFEVPTPEEGSKVLLIVSAMARTGGPFPTRLEARPSRGPEPHPSQEPTSPQRQEIVRKTLPMPTPGEVPTPAVGMPPSDRDFSILAREGDPAIASNYQRIRARLRALGSWVQVYVDEQDLAKVQPETLRDLVSTFEEHILPTAARNFGVARDIDGDGRFTILLTGKLASLAGENGALDGFVRGADFDPRMPEPFGNRADMMYLSADLQSGPYLRTILAHEYTHAVTFCRKVVDQPNGFSGNHDEEGWLDEGLAHLTEDLHRFSRENLDYRVRAFLAAPERYQLVVKDYYEADLFRSHGNRGSTYLFLDWCAEQFGPGFLPSMVRSPLRGIENLERTTGASFEELYRQWSAQLYLDLLEPKPESSSTPKRDWSPNGPRATELRPGGRPETWEALGTASRYFLIGASSTGKVRIEIEAPREADLQVTAVRLPDDLPRLEVEANLVASSDERSQDLHLRVRPQGNMPARLESLEWGPLVPYLDAARRQRSIGSLKGAELKATMRGFDLLQGGEEAESFPIPLTSEAVSGGPLLVRLVGIDGRGRRVVGWAEVDPSEPLESLEDLATARPR